MNTTYQFLIPAGFRAVRIKRSVQEEVSKKVAKGLCVSCGEPLIDGEKVDRGCHESCGQSLRRATKGDANKDAQFIREGRWLPPSKGGRPPTNPTSIALKEAEA